MGYKHLNKPPFSGAGSSEYMYGSYRSGHRRSSVPNRAGSCGCPYYRGCKASLLFISSAVCSRLAKKCKNTKNSGVILRILILEYWLSIPHWLAQGFYCLLTKDVRCPYHMVGRFPEMHNDPLLLPISLRAWTGRGVGTLGISGWGCTAGTLEPLTYTRA